MQFPNSFFLGVHHDDDDDNSCRKKLDFLADKLKLKNNLRNDSLQKTIDEIMDNETELSENWMELGSLALHLFIKSNWTGPVANDDELEWLAQKKEEAYRELNVGIEYNDNVIHLEVLYLAKLIFENEKIVSTYESAMWWFVRVNYILQMILDDVSNTILQQCELIIEKIYQNTEWYHNAPIHLKVLFHVEVAQFFLLYKRINESDKHLEIAQSMAGLIIELRGAMGKRTKYQIKEKALLYLNIEKEKEIDHPVLNCNSLPISVNLNDDVRLEHIEFIENMQQPKLNLLDEIIILAKCHHLQVGQPKDNLATEEIIPYLDTIIESTKNWPLKMEALRQRSALEIKDKRSIERALSQSESLIGQYNQSVPSECYRMYTLFASGMKPIWAFKQNLADAMLSLGMIKGALDLYLQLQLWEEVIVCYTILELRHKAAEIIRQEISKKPTVKLWCLLGDSEQNTNHYETAWKLSGEKSSRVQRHWGLYYFSKQLYAESIPHLKLSVELNNIQENVWIRLGFACLQVEDWNSAAKSYRHYCDLEQSSFEAWNNLAKAYIKLGDKLRAYHALHDAIKCNYEKWEVWDNLMIVCIDLGYFSEVIRCYHRILELKGKHVDIQVLEILTKVINDKVSNSESESARKLLHQALELFGRLTALIQTNPHVWRLYAELTILNETDLDYQKAAQYLQRSYRASSADTKWFQKIESTKNMLQLCESLANAYLKCTHNVSVGIKRSMLGSAKLSLQSVITKVKQEKLEEHNEIVEILMSVENLLKHIVEELDKVKNTD
ncbi:hypothetical protein PV328_009240 [Microctonus aethiopoides]|uniref:Tetratricopeptide repeat protein 27 n=1 Tax=Microctonus aethiopoides TaxID=144406 RepID=A0AA39EZ41_9HYME|nr:hypothetical protein PV328_009240 [Microctonus aethiopoides]